MNNLTLKNLENAKTLEAYTLINYYAYKYFLLDEDASNAIDLYSKAKDILKLLGLYNDLTIGQSIKIISELSEENKELFRSSYGYSFVISYWRIDELVKQWNKDGGSIVLSKII